MRHRVKHVILAEAAAALLFFGAFIHNAALEKSGNQALQELSARGYTLAEDPIRVYPSGTGGDMSGAHAGGWRPGVVAIRENPQENVGSEIFLRHELMHEASYRTCGNRMPLWAEEAAAIHFSGELLPDPQVSVEDPDQEAVAALAGRSRSGALLDRDSYRTLSQLVAFHGWPATPCAVSEAIESRLQAVSPAAATGFSAILIHLASGRVLAAQGDQKSRHPPGSLLKIPYAAALREGQDGALGEELAKSDAAGLLRRKESFDLDRYRFFLSPVADAPLGSEVAQDEPAGWDEPFWRRYLGERDAAGFFSFAASLPELAKVLRASLLFRPEPFHGLARNGFLVGSTLAGQPQAEKEILAQLHALSKTGTVADARDTPLIGHLMVAWPAERPVFLAVFRGFGVAGAGVLRQAAPLLKRWSTRHPVENATVRVRIMSLTPRDSWEIIDESPSFVRQLAEGKTLRVSTGGRFRILSSAQKSKSERMIAGTLESAADGRTVVLETDTLTYTEGVLAAEAQDLPLAAHKVMAAVIAWNGVHGGHRHPETGSLCDSTHCMVYLGEPEAPGAAASPLDPELLGVLGKLSAERGSSWLSFAKGGEETWTRRIAADEVSNLVGEPRILDIRRERTRSGAVMVRLSYQEDEEVVSCEVFRNSLKLFSCPDTISHDPGTGTWVFSGIGEGHGEGLSMERARALAHAGRNAREILIDAYAQPQGR